MIRCGVVESVRNGTLCAKFPASVAIGEGVRVQCERGDVDGVVTAVRDRAAIVALHAAANGVSAGDEVRVDPEVLTLPLGTPLLGRAIDAWAAPLDGFPRPCGSRRTVALRAPLVAQRSAITRPFWTGIRAIDGLLTIGLGARVGIFGPPGCGKSTLLEIFAGSVRADAVVVGLVGERGREAEGWVRAINPRTTLVCATSDRSSAERVRAAEVASAQAAALRARGLDVLLILDSFARYAAALRELAVAAGESVGRGGYPPSVFARMAELAELCGAAHNGSVTLVASVLSDGDARDPVSDAARSLLDGHLELAPALAAAGRFPAIDVVASCSRTADAVVHPGHAQNAAAVRAALALLERTADARALGLPPADPAAIRAALAEPGIESFLRQGKQAEAPERTLSRLAALADTLR